MDSIVICGTFQDAASYILEWIAFHRLIGVDRFVLYDRGSSDGTAGLIAGSRFGRQVTVIDRPRDEPSAAPYADFIANHADGHSWAAILDPGDFLHPLATDSLRPLLPRYEGFSAVLLRRMLFVLPPQFRQGQLMTGICTNRAPDGSPRNATVAALVRVRDMQGVGGSPAAFSMAGEPCDAGGQRVATPASWDQAPDAVLVVNRYRRVAEQQETVADRRMTRFLPRLRAMLHDNAAAAAPRPVPAPSLWPQAPPAPPVARASTRPPLASPVARTPPAVATAAPPRAEAPAPPAAAFVPRSPPAPAAAAPPATARSAAASLPPPASPSPAPARSAGAALPPPTQPAATVSPTPRSQPSGLTLGIGIATYNRESVLGPTLDRVRQHTRHPRTVVAVADDGSTDGTLEMLRTRQVLTVTGRNTGVAWNKNRALFLLTELMRCDVVILLEDDAFPMHDNWEAEWMQAALRWGHVNVAADWLREHFIAGSGTLDDPILSHRLTAQCAVFSRESILFGGYFDTRFRGYGHEHVEHSWRLLRMGYGGSDWTPESKTAPQFKLIWGGIGHHLTPSAAEALDWQTERNRVLAQLLLGEYSYRPPYQNEEEARRLRDEMRGTLPRAVL